MKEPKFLFLLIFICSGRGAQYCANDVNSDPPLPDPVDYCNATSWAKFPSPTRDRCNATENVPDCTVQFMLDLSPDYVSETDYDEVLLFALDQMTKQCWSKGVGYNVIAFPLFNGSSAKSCCSSESCEQMFSSNHSPYEGWVQEFYPKNETFYPDSSAANFTYVLDHELKKFNGDNWRCLYNTVVLITNRLFQSGNNTSLDQSIQDVINFSCITLTVILVGRGDIEEFTFEKYYANLTTHMYIVPEFRCLYLLADCIAPCGDRGANQCELDELRNCAYPTTLPSTARPETTPTTSPKVYPEYLHVMYLFALSNKTTEAEFKNALYYVQTPLQQCTNEKIKYVARFFAIYTESDWLDTMPSITKFLDGLEYDLITVPATRTIDENENHTMQLVREAVNTPIVGEMSGEGPKLILVTDFVSVKFRDAFYAGIDQDIKKLQKFDFEIYAFLEDVAKEYENKTYVKSTHIHVDDNFVKESGPVLCEKKKSNTYTIWIIIIGTSFGLMIILLVCTVLYRQKLMWLQKLNRFKNNIEDEDDPNVEDVIDYWELSWDKLIVRSERLGHGAYGQVYKGRLLGMSPGLERYYRQEASQFENCDCAVKMLPKHANEKAHAEFMHEIDLMKALGYNEHIVNMLGCITSTSSKSCLVLEYCSNRDLLRYLKKRKAELEESRSIDDQIDCTKEFLHFAWQIATGMKFLVSQNIIHRDLAARNILIDEMKNAKIADFGLCMQSSADAPAVSGSGRLPIKWLAIESLQRQQFSFKSDVWSYGIVLFEMYSMGEIPFSDIEPAELLQHLLDDKRPKRPLLASDKLWEVMNRCWDKSPDHRPTFDELLTIFTILLEQATEGYGYLSVIKGSEHYLAIENLQPQIAIIEELVDETPGEGHPIPRSRTTTTNTNANGVRLFDNFTNVMRRTAAGISRQFSNGADAYEAGSKPALEKPKKKKLHKAESASRKNLSASSTNLHEIKEPKRKTRELFNWDKIRQSIDSHHPAFRQRARTDTGSEAGSLPMNTRKSTVHSD